MEKNEKIIQAVVYQDQVQVTRQASFDLSSGDTCFSFVSVSPLADPDSFRVKAFGDGVIQIEGVEVREEILEADFSESLTRLQEEQQEISREILSLRRKGKRFEREESYLLSVHQVLGNDRMTDFALGKTSAEEIENLIQLAREGAYELLSQKMELEKQKRQTEQKKNQLERKISGRGEESKKSRRVVTVQFSVIKPGAVRLLLSYLVSGASWEPFYDARLTEDFQNLEISYYAGVSQSTGEDWDETELILSTSNPSRDAGLPELKTWFLDLEPSSHLENSVSGGQGFPSSGGTTVNFKVSKKETVKSDGSRKKTSLDFISLPVSLEYFLMPRESCHAFIYAKTENHQAYSFLPGGVSAYQGMDFVGQSRMPLTVPGESLRLYLGIDEGIRVERELLNRLKGSKGFKGSQDQLGFKYRIRVKNDKEQAVSVTVSEPLPVSRNSEIKVRLESSEPQYHKKDEQSLLSWNLSLKPGEVQEIVFEYTVTWPSERSLTGLE